MKINPLFCIDFYKSGHIYQYPKGTEVIYSNFTARSNKNSNIKNEEGIIFFGLQYFIMDFIIETFYENFFNRPIEKVIKEYKDMMDNCLGKDVVRTDHIEALHKLGYLPIQIKSLPEGELIPFKVPFITIENTHPKFFWLTNYLETVLSCYLWKPITTATTAYHFKKLFYQYAKKTGGDLEFINFQGHDFSFRGLGSVQDAIGTGMAHLTSFRGTDTVIGVEAINNFYKGKDSKSIIGASVPATEHSVMCAYGKDNEYMTFYHLLKKIYRNGILSIVSDTWNFWHVIDNYLENLKPIILYREGKLVIRPDSGDPKEIIPKLCNRLWNIFGGKINEKGYKELDPHIGIIYGDAINYETASIILKKLKKDKFCSTNVVFGIGSYTYQYVTRDTYGFAIKSTAAFIPSENSTIFDNESWVKLYKDPKTDSGIKKSAKGLLRVEKENDKYVLYDSQSPDECLGGKLETCFINGEFIQKYSIDEIREKIDKLIRENHE